MKQNLELKYFCQDFSKIRKILKEIGAKKEIIKKQKDYFFNLPVDKKKISPRMKLRIEDKELIYYERPDFIADKNTLAKIEVYEVKDDRLLDFFIKALGVKAIVEKKREVWRKGNTVFFIDTVKNVGNIFEVEMQKHSAMNKKDRELFESYKTRLLPYLGKLIKGSNVDLVLKNKINNRL